MASAKPRAFKTARSRPLSLIRRIGDKRAGRIPDGWERFFTLGARAVTFPPHAVSEDQIKEALKTVKYPGFSRDIVSFGLVKGIDAATANVTVQLALATNDPAIPQTIKTKRKTRSRTRRRA